MIKFIFKYWELILISILIGSLILIFTSWRNEVARADRMTENYSSIKNEPARQIAYLTKDEFKTELKDLLDSIKLHISSNIRAKDINNITTIKEFYIDSSKTVYMPYEIKKGVYDISYVSDCFGFKGNFNLIDTTVSLSDKWFTNQTEIVVYDDKKHWFNKKWLPRWGMTKNVRLEQYDKCNSKKVIIRTNIVK